MLKLSKKVEYGILSLQYLAENEGQLVTAKEIAQNLDLSFEFLAKTMQKLNKKGLIISHQGIKGGYQLSRPANEINLNHIFNSLEPNAELVDCLIDGDLCERSGNCSIQNPLKYLQTKINKIFEDTSLFDLKMKPNEQFVQLKPINIK